MFYPIRLTPLTSSLSRTYILPALLLNPILFLHSLNTILSRILPPVVVPDTTVQPSPYSTKGPSAEHPHVDIHASDTLCWSYTMVMVGMQLVAFGKVQMCREERKERLRRKREGDRVKGPQKVGWGMDGANDGMYNGPNATLLPNGKDPGRSSTYGVHGHSRREMGAFNDPLDEETGYGESEESEVIP